MPTSRRLVYVVIALVLTIVYLRSGSNSSSISPTQFYSRTGARMTADGYRAADSLDKIEPVRGSSATKKLSTEDADSEAMSARLREAESLAKDNANKKAPSREAVMGSTDGAVSDQHNYHTGVQELVTGDPKNPNVLNVPVPPQPTQNRSLRKKPVEETEVKTPQEIEEEEAVKDVLNDLFKMAPIIIFSKSYCQFSKKAKHYLTEVYKIEPAPYVVELDLIELGSSIQHLLADITKRSTVPNVMVRGHSIGGGDDIQALHQKGQLEATVREYGGSQIMKMTLMDQNA